MSSNVEVPAHFFRDAPLDPHQRKRHRAVLKAVRALPRGAVLDYGCGWGDITWAISKTHPDVHGVDVDAKRVAFAQSQYPELKFSVCRPDGLDFPDASFDIVVSGVVLPFVPDEAEYLAEIRRVLRPGGHLVLATKVCPIVRQFWHRLRGRPERSRDADGVGLRSHIESDILQLLADGGFELQRRGGFYDPPFDSRKNLADLVNATIQLVGEPLGIVSTAPYLLTVSKRT